MKLITPMLVMLGAASAADECEFPKLVNGYFKGNYDALATTGAACMHGSHCGYSGYGSRPHTYGFEARNAKATIQWGTIKASCYAPNKYSKTDQYFTCKVDLVNKESSYSKFVPSMYWICKYKDTEHSHDSKGKLKPVAKCADSTGNMMTEIQIEKVSKQCLAEHISIHFSAADNVGYTHGQPTIGGAYLQREIFAAPADPEWQSHSYSRHPAHGIDYAAQYHGGNGQNGYGGNGQNGYGPP